MLEANAKADGVVTLPSGLQYKVLVEGSRGTGVRSPLLDTECLCHYRGKLALDGTDAEYTLTTELVDTPDFDTSYKCDKFDAPCPQEYWMASEADELSDTSGARRPALGAGVLGLVAAASAWALAPRRLSAERSELVSEM